MLLGDQEPRQAEFGQSCPDIARHRLAALGEGAHAGEGARAAQHAGDGGLHQALIGGKGEIH